jgi:protein TIF31
MPKQENSPVENSSKDDNKENNTQLEILGSKEEKHNVAIIHVSSSLVTQDDYTEEDTSDEGWQEALPKSRSTGNRRLGANANRKPSLAKLNTNTDVLNITENGRIKGKPSPSSSSNSLSQKLVKSSSFNAAKGSSDKSPNAKSAPVSPAMTTAVAPKSVSSSAQRKALSYKEVALAAPGTLVKTVKQEELPKDSKEPADAEVTKDAATVGPDETGLADKIDSPKNEFEDPLLSVKDKDGEKKESIEGKVSESKEERDEKKVVDTKTDLERSDIKEDKVKVGPVTEKSPASLNSHKVEKECKEDKDIFLNVETAHTPESTFDHLESEKETKNEDQAQVTSGSDSEKSPSSTEGSKKESSSKLSASAPPFNPSTVPVYGSFPLPGFKEIGGILPHPVNVPPMLTVPVRKQHSHQSATARVPYGPRIAGGYNRPGHRGARSKLVFPNGEAFVDEGGSFAPKVMNPNAAEFVPGQGWVATGCYGISNSPNSVIMYPITPVSPETGLGSENNREGDDGSVLDQFESQEDEKSNKLEEVLDNKSVEADADSIEIAADELAANSGGAEAVEVVS